MYLDVFLWAKFRKHKGGIKIHTLYDIETQIPTFFHITSAKVNGVNAMDVIPYEIGSYYDFDRAYNDFKRLYRIKTLDSFFVVRSKKNFQYKTLNFSQHSRLQTYIKIGGKSNFSSNGPSSISRLRNSGE